MNPVGKAVWYIETHLGDDLSLADVAHAAGRSKFHLVRAFGAYSGKSVMRYVRQRRLSEAAKRLVAETGGILDVALEAGYHSHEAFSRAFRGQFGITPDQLRNSRCLKNLDLLEPLKMNADLTDIIKPTIVDSDAMLIVGLKKRYSNETSAQMPAQWQAFQPHIGNIDHQKDSNTAFGVLCNSDGSGNTDYLTGVEVSQIPDFINDLDGLRLAPQTYAVFKHDSHISEIKRTWATIFGKWLPETNSTLADAPQLERYGAGFDPHAGIGDIQIWIPIHR